MLTHDNSIQFVKDEAPPVSLRNFFPPENGFVWSTSYWSDITFAFSPTPAGVYKAAEFTLDFDVFKMGGHIDGQNVLIYLNGLRVASHYITQRTTVVIRLDPALLEPTDNVITFDTPDSRKPSEFGLPDERRLGVQLFSMQIRPIA
jgi:hypothetical protein